MDQKNGKLGFKKSKIENTMLPAYCIPPGDVIYLIYSILAEYVRVLWEQSGWKGRGRERPMQYYGDMEVRFQGPAKVLRELPDTLEKHKGGISKKRREVRRALTTTWSS